MSKKIIKTITIQTKMFSQRKNFLFGDTSQTTYEQNGVIFMSKFCPIPWPEDPTPKHLQSCEKCGLYKHGSRMVWGEGNPTAPVMVILDNPGARENREGNPFVCSTRQTLQQAAFEVGLSENDLYVTYILKRRPIKAYDKPRTRQICIHHLYQQLKEYKPKLLFCLGNVSVQNFFQNKDVDVKTLRGQTHDINGVPTIVAYHPLAIRRRPNLWESFLEDWQFLADTWKSLC